MDTKDIDLKALHHELVDAFINYQHRLENPMPLSGHLETDDAKIHKYQTDLMFRAKIGSIVGHVMSIVVKHIDA